MTGVDQTVTIRKQGIAEPLTSPIPLEEFEASRKDPSTGITLPSGAYTDDDFYRFELASVWERSWVCVGRVDQITEIGDYYTSRLAPDEPVIVSRAGDDEIVVMSAVCQHRGMCVTAPPKRPREEWGDPPPSVKGNTRTFRCPYHWWTYDLRGRLIGAPDMHHREKFDREESGLPRLPVEVWKGFIFTTLNPDPRPLGPSLAKADQILANYCLDDMVSTEPEVLENLPFNWKLMVENFMEGYHNSRLHNDLYDVARGDDPKSEGVLGGHMEFGRSPGEGIIIGRSPTAFKDRGLNPTQRALFPPIESLDEHERWQMIYFCVPPSLIVGVNTDSIFWFRVTPDGPESHTLSMSYAFPRSTVEMKLFPQLFEQHIKGVEYFNEEDLPANFATQIGLRSRFAPRSALAKGDLFLSQFSAWLLEHFEVLHDIGAAEKAGPA